MSKNLFKENLIQIEDSVLEVEGLKKGEYDAQAVQYDKLISNGLYNRIMWGNTPEDYSGFCRKAIKNNSEGIIADIGCGTLGFTYKTYAEFCKKELYLCDLSYEMLKIGKDRLQEVCDDLSAITFLRSDALDMPFKENAVQTVLNFGIFHIFKNPSILIKEMKRILKPEGELYLTGLCTDRKWSGKYLKLLYKKGHVAQVLSSVEIKNIVEKSGITITDFKVKGGMTYLTGKKLPV